jgi:hypothetical protein
MQIPGSVECCKLVKLIAWRCLYSDTGVRWALSAYHIDCLAVSLFRYWGSLDVEFMEAWLADLHDLGVENPKVTGARNVP